MKVILLEDITPLGRLGDVVRVRGGYARNYLLPQGKAEYASADAVAQFHQRRAKLEKRQQAQRADLEKAQKALSGSTLVIAVRAVADGNLYGSITAHIIAGEINKQKAAGDFVIRRGQVVLPEGAIKTVGAHPAQIRLTADLPADIIVRVSAQSDDGTAEILADASAETPAQSDDSAAAKSDTTTTTTDSKEE